MKLIPYAFDLPFLDAPRQGYHVVTAEGIGELAPFPGTHNESLEEAKEALMRGDRSLPSVAFALDMARWKKTGEKASSYTLIHHGMPLPEGPQPVKLKIGKNPAQDLERIRELHARGCTIRLDVNRRWDLQEALSFNLDTPVEYIEEPLKNSCQLSELYREKGWPLALDETLYLGEPWEEIEGVVALILKPNALGSLEQTYALSKEAKRRGIRGVISTCFESELGREFLAELSETLFPGELVGLGVSSGSL